MMEGKDVHLKKVHDIEHYDHYKYYTYCCYCCYCCYYKSIDFVAEVGLRGENHLRESVGLEHVLMLMLYLLLRKLRYGMLLVGFVVGKAVWFFDFLYEG